MLSTTVAKVQYTCNGVTTAFAIPFLFYENAHIVAELYDPVALSSTSLVEVTDYGLTGAGAVAGGQLNMLAAPANGLRMTITRAVPYEQQTDYKTDDDLDSEQLERDFDLVVMALQQIAEQISRSLLLPLSSTYSGLTLPDPEAGKVLAWNALANALQNFDLASVSAVLLPLSIANGGTGASSKAAAQAALDIAATTGFTMSGKFIPKQGADIASASTVNLVNATGNVVSITGSVNIQSFGAPQDGAMFFVHFQGTPIVEHNAAVSQPIILRSGANEVMTADSVRLFVKRAAKWYEVAGGSGASSGSDPLFQYLYFGS